MRIVMSAHRRSGLDKRTMQVGRGRRRQDRMRGRWRSDSRRIVRNDRWRGIVPDARIPGVSVTVPIAVPVTIGIITGSIVRATIIIRGWCITRRLVWIGGTTRKPQHPHGEKRQAGFHARFEKHCPHRCIQTSHTFRSLLRCRESDGRWILIKVEVMLGHDPLSAMHGLSPSGDFQGSRGTCTSMCIGISPAMRVRFLKCKKGCLTAAF